jgi:hypothetical protein
MILAVAPATHAGTVIHVDDDAAAGGDGVSWGTAFRFLQDALAAGPGVTEIRVAQGIYRPDRSEASPGGTGDRQAKFQLASGQAVRGGYAGIGAPDPDARDTELYETVLSGDLLGDDGPDFANNGENSLNVVSGNLTDGTAILDGFTITAGNANLLHTFDNGAGMEILDGSPTVVGCLLTENSAVASGGGMYVTGGAPTVTGCRFIGNVAGFGGGLKSDFASPSVIRCLFRENSAGDGGGLQSADSDSTVIGCAFVENAADSIAGGVDFLGGVSSMSCCTLAGNSAGTSGGLRVFVATLAMTNSIVWGNSSTDGTQISVTLFSDLTVSHCDVEGADSGIVVDDDSSMSWLAGNIAEDPLFVDPATGDHRLLPESPCLDAADNTAIPGAVEHDLDGNPRFVDDPRADTGVGACPIADMGAFERQAGSTSCCAGDFDGSGDVAFPDLLALLAAWGNPGGPEDLDGDDLVGFGDLLILLAAWGPCGS